MRGDLLHAVVGNVRHHDPLAAAASRSTESTPIPYRAMTLQRSSRPIISASIRTKWVRRASASGPGHDVLAFVGHLEVRADLFQHRPLDLDRRVELARHHDLEPLHVCGAYGHSTTARPTTSPRFSRS